MIKNSMKHYMSQPTRDKLKPFAIIAGVVVVIGILVTYLSWTDRSNKEVDVKSTSTGPVETVNIQNPETPTVNVEPKTGTKPGESDTQTQGVKYLGEELARLKNQQEELASRVKKLEKQIQDVSTTVNRSLTNKVELVEAKKSIEIKKSSGEKKSEKSVNKTRGKESKISYTIKKGDTLWGIADKYDVSVTAIKEWNNLRDTRLDIGDKITIIKP